MKTFVSGSRHHSGFTLLELVLAMLLLALLVGMVFSTATTNVALSNAVITKQNEESTKTAFLGLMSRQFSGLPGNTRMKLTYKDAGSAYLSDLTLQNVPLDFTWGGVQKVAKAVQLSTVQKRNGFLDIVLKYYEEEIIQDNDHPEDNPNVEPFAQVILLEDVRVFEWQVLNGSTLEWQYDWDLVGRLPLQVELKIAFGANGEVIRQIFWITPKQDPEVMMRQLTQQARQGGGVVNPGNPTSPSNPNGPPRPGPTPGPTPKP